MEVSIYKIKVLIYPYNRSTDISVKPIFQSMIIVTNFKNLFVIKSKGGK